MYVSAFTKTQELFIWAIPVLFAITVHEVAHGWVAKQCGDKTAYILGRLTLNPFKHIDPVGTVLVPLLLFFSTGFVFGWAKPVPVSERNFKNPKRDMILVALAGPGVNILMALIWAVILQLASSLLYNTGTLALVLHNMAIAGIIVNVLLACFNILPIPPLDGSRVLGVFLKGRLALWYYNIEKYGLFIIAFLLFTGVLSSVLHPLMQAVFSMIGAMVSLF